MPQPYGSQPAYQRTPLSADEQTRAELNFVPYVAQTLAAHGRFRVSADSPDMVGLFQRVARRVSVPNGREITITFGGEEDPGLTGAGARTLRE
jgi:hypothetical protein